MTANHAVLAIDADGDFLFILCECFPQKLRGALESAIGIATLKTPVVFGNEANDPVKYLFCLSAKDNMEHLNALAELAGMFEDAQFYRLLEQAESAKEIMEYISK